MTQDNAPSLQFTVTNPSAVGAGVARSQRFDRRGGSVGSAASDTWRLSAHRTGVVPGHAEIRFADGDFCLIDRSGRTFINGASQPIGRGRRARLKHGDQVSIGVYQLRVDLAADTDQPTPGLPGVEQEPAAWLGDEPETPLRAASAGPEPATDEPVQALDRAGPTPVSDDPLAQWQRRADAAAEDSVEAELLASESAWFARDTDVSGDYRENRDGAMGLPRHRKSTTTENDRMSDTTPQTDQPRPDASRQHISGAPLLRGLAAELAFQDSDDMRLFLEEAGQTLKATIEGLLALHQGEDSRHQALRTRLQPIEDNPLRLGQDYQDTVQTLFASQRSPVHLSAPAAVRESLDSLNHHQQATREAIREGLAAILHAFSPEALLRRFHGYRRGLQEHEDEGRWAWDMYCHYYTELKSSRQQGFERLFQEVFDQAYDQHLRQLQRENLL